MKLSVLMLFMVCLISSCTKFEEGSNFSLKSVKSRLCGEWTLTSAIMNNNIDVTSSFSPLKLNLKKDETCILTSNNTSANYTWSLNDDKTILTIWKPDGTKESETEIVLLEKKKLKLRDNGANVMTQTFEK